MFTKLRQLFGFLFGDFSWTPPGWLRRSSRALAGWVRAHRLNSILLLLLVLALAGGGWWLREWQKNRPKPFTISVKAEPPGVTFLDTVLHPQPLIVQFGGSVARLSEVGKPVAAGVRLEPSVNGHWKWETDSQLAFIPKADWPADQKYRIILDRTLTPPHVLLARYEVEATTPKFAATFKNAEFYTDPTDPAVKQVVATVEFTHAVDAAALEKSVALAMIGESEVFKSGMPRFAVTQGLHRRVAYIRSSALNLPEREDFMRVTVNKGLPTMQGGAVTEGEIEKKVRIPDIYSFFKIKSVEGIIVRTNEGDPEQVIVVETTAAAKPEEIKKALRVYLLPKKTEEELANTADKNKEGGKAELWTPKEVDEPVIQRAIQLPLAMAPAGKANSLIHTFKISLEAEGQLYITVSKGIQAEGGFILGDEYTNVLPVPVLPREILIQGNGGVLALNGERKLSIKSRAVAAIQYTVARVPADQINHLVSQTRGEFQNPSFRGYAFDEENIARIATEKQDIHVTSKFKANYSAFDFAKHLQPVADGGSALQGLFFLKAREWHPPKKKKDSNSEAGNAEASSDEEEDEDGGDDSEKKEQDAEDRRFILVTDLGLIVKENTDKSRDVFIASIKTGAPIEGVEIEVLGKNGVPLANAKTGADGRANFAALSDARHEKKPVAFVARSGNDVAFMPYGREDRKLDFSKFDIGGVESVSGAELDAFVFTERGIYRPGDEIRAGLIVKQRNWAGKLEGLPVEIEVIDARGTSVLVRKLALPAMGFAETSYTTAYESPTGYYSINVYLVKNGERDMQLGSTSVNVKEFLPDRMKIESRLSKDAKGGWVTPEGLQAAITLKNLYGTSATNRRLKANAVLSPAGFMFEQYAGFSFYDRLRDGKPEVQSQNIDLGEKTTDEQGSGTIELKLERFADATYSTLFFVEGFEADSGRSVSTSNAVLVSPLPHVVGFKADGDLSYIPMGTPRAVEWIAIDPALKKVALENLECRLIEHSFISVLTKAENGNWVYESVEKNNLVRTEPVKISAEGLKYAVPVDVPGRYEFDLRDKETGARLSQVNFRVVGRGTASKALNQNAELELKLSKDQYNTGDEIEMSVTAPYTGSGLITIERDKVYAHTWFKADKTSSVQRIRVPEGFEGTGYVSVCFVRGLDAKEVFMSPLSNAVMPFKANIEKRRLPVTLRVPEKAIPGEPFRIGYKTDRPAKIVVYAVDQGILQVSDYKLPDPLAHFFRKEALMVSTSQIVDLILPEFSILRKMAAFGGDGEEKHLNPFKRVTEKPVVYWSGVIDADVREQEVVYNVPDYFSGTLTVMAVAVASDGVGSAEKNSLVRGPFVITPNVPTTAAPGDVFDVSATVANGVTGSGENAEVRLVAEPSEHLEIVKGPQQPLRISEGSEISATFTVRAKEKFGSANLVFRASTRGQETKLRSTLSVRPAVAFMTSVLSGNFTRESTEVEIDRVIHPDFRKLRTVISAVPLGLAHGLDFYLKNYPNGCSEQITSGAFCRLTLSDETDFGLSRAEVNAQLEHTFAVLRRRQNDQGSFGYWAPENNAGIDFISVYVMHFLIEAKAAGFAPPLNVFQNGLRHLQAIAVLEPRDLREARTQAYAIYLLTREGVITTNYVLNLRDFLGKRYAKQWPSDLTAVYLAGACSMLKKEDEAQKLLKGFKIGAHDPSQWWDFYSPLGADSQFIAMLARHFPDNLKKITTSQFEAIVKPVGQGDFTTLSAAYAVLALKNYSQQMARNAPELGITEISGQDKETPLRLDGAALVKRSGFNADAVKLRFSARNQVKGGMGAFYQVVEAGYDRSLPTKTIADGLEVFREFLDEHNAVTHTARLGEPITVRLRIRTLKRGDVSNVAILDLLPGGFELAAGSLQPGVGSAGCDYVDVREDRNVFFATIGGDVREITYKIKPTNRGTYVVPPVFAEAMYDRTIKARGLPDKITVIDGK